MPLCYARGGLTQVLEKMFITDGVVRHCSKLSRKVDESPSPEVIKRCVNVVLRGKFYGELDSVRFILGLDYTSFPT